MIIHTESYLCTKGGIYYGFEFAYSFYGYNLHTWFMAAGKIGI